MPKPIKLSESEITSALSKLPQWKFDDGKLHRNYTFTDFVSAFGFMTGAALIAQRMNHHLCVDKTGTLTLNQMPLKRLDVEGNSHVLTVGSKLPERVHNLTEYAILASKRDPFDPMERALQTAGEKWLLETEHLHPDWSLIKEYPLAPELLAMTHAWNCGGDEAGIAHSENVLTGPELNEMSNEVLARQIREVNVFARVIPKQKLRLVMAIILANQSWALSILGGLMKPNSALWWVLGGTCVFLALALILPAAQHLFHFAPLHGKDLFLACAAGVVSILWFEVFKILRHRTSTPIRGS